jgi:uncharacterized protein (TIGR02145 family)
MKSLFTLFLLITSLSIIAQAPQKFSYQAVIRNSSNQLLINQQIGLKISILQGSENGNAVYSERHVPTTNTNGVATISIGTGSLLVGEFQTINWSNGPYFIQTETDINGGTNYTISSTQQLLSVPYALHAGNGIMGVSETGDSLLLGNGTFLIIPGISSANNDGGGGSNTVTDVQGNIYATVQIGTQRWMAENLRTTKFCNGEDIPQISNDNNWNTATTPGWCVYNADPTNDTLFGKLYNWFTVSDPRNACPCGWHVPSDVEFTTLTDFLGTESAAGGKMKSTGTLSGGDGLWSIANFGATNESGFNGLPGGGRASGAQFSGVYVNAWFWNSSSFSSTTAWRRVIENLSPGVTRSEVNKKTGCSVRCIQN